jgi:L-malate glycosyltransferase
MRVTQVIAAAAPGDAITGQALAWQRALAEWGHEGGIVAEHVHPDLVSRVLRLDGGGRRELGSGSVILHYSVWSAAIPAALDAPGPTAVCYHNITPGDLLREANPSLASDCDRARSALPMLRGRAAALIADSAFNARELETMGLRAEVVPLLLDLDRPPGPRRPEPGPRPTVVSVGRIVPNKRIEDVIKVFALYQRHRAPGARLRLVGSDGGFERYRQALDDLVRRLGVRDVSFTGRVDDAVRDAAYREADAYLCMSVHEGFCAPLVEAMAAGLPIVARDAAAVSETVGPGGIVLDEPLPVVAEALHEVVSSPDTRRGLRAGARRRLAELAPAVIASRLRAALTPVLEAR